MTCLVEIFHYGIPVYRNQVRLYDVEEMSWEDQAKSRERQLNLKIDRLIMKIPFYDKDLTKIFITFKSKMDDHSNWVLKGEVDDGGGDCDNDEQGDERSSIGIKTSIF